MWLYRSTGGGASYSWAGRWKVTDTAPNPQTFSGPNFVAGNLYQVRQPGPRATCAEVGQGLWDLGT